MKFFATIFALALVAHFACGIITPIPRRLLAPAYQQRTGKVFPEGILGIIDDENHPHLRIAGNDQPSVREMAVIADRLCGKERPPIHYIDMVERFSHILWETTNPSTYVLKVFLADNSGPGPLGGPLLTARGDFNSSRYCRPVKGCGLVNRRSSTFDGDNVTTFGTAFFMLSENPGRDPYQEMCGYDSAIIRSGTLGNSFDPGNGGIEDVSYIYPVFKNVRSKLGQITLDIFSNGGFGANTPGDAGVGKNEYILLPEGNTHVRLVIRSSFDLKDPFTGQKIIYGYQDTVWTIPRAA